MPHSKSKLEHYIQCMRTTTCNTKTLDVHKQVVQQQVGSNAWTCLIFLSRAQPLRQLKPKNLQLHAWSRLCQLSSRMLARSVLLAFTQNGLLCQADQRFDPKHDTQGIQCLTCCARNGSRFFFVGTPNLLTDNCQRYQQ